MIYRKSHSGRTAAWRAGLGALALLLALPAAAAAADLPVLRGTVSGPIRWDGVVMGGSLGYSNMSADFGNANSSEIAYILRDTTLENEFQPSSWTTLPKGITNSNQFGFFLGYNWQMEELVLGFDVGYNRPSSLNSSASDSIARSATTSDSVTHDVYVQSSADLKLVDYATVRARAGYAFGQFLPYAALGVGIGRFNSSTSATVTDYWTPSGGTQVQYGPLTQSDGQDNIYTAGFDAGLGLDVAVLPNVFLRAEWEYIYWGPVSGIKSSLNTGRVGIGVRF